MKITIGQVVEDTLFWFIAGLVFIGIFRHFGWPTYPPEQLISYTFAYAFGAMRIRSRANKNA